MADTPAALKIGLQHHLAGRLEAAEQVYREILSLDPNQADALHLLGVIASQQGRHDVAVEHITRAIELKGNDAVFYSNLGNVLKDQGRLDEAVAAFRRALELHPEFAEALSNLGNTLRDLRKFDEAVASHRRAVQLLPNSAAIHHNLGNALRDSGQLDSAIESYCHGIQLNPDFAEAHDHLGSALRDQGKFEAAIVSHRRALALKADNADAWNNLGLALRDQGKLDEAAAAHRQALGLNPKFADALSNLGNVLADQGRLDEAIACYRKALGLKPNTAEACNDLGVALREQGKLQEAEAYHRRALDLNPDLAEAHYNLGNALKEQGQLDAAAACYRRALELKPHFAAAHSNLGNVFKDQRAPDKAMTCYRRTLDLKWAAAPTAHSNLLLTLQYRSGMRLSDLAAAHAEYERLYAEPLYPTRRAHENDRNPQRRLRVGFVSPDFGKHPVGYFLISLLESLDGDEVQTICYSDRAVKDDLTVRLQSAATTWHDVKPLSDAQLAEKIRADRIDILFDLAGHTAGNRLLMFARKPAPIQVSWLGYVGTTGLRAIDYVLGDRDEIPPQAEAHFCERVLRMPHGYVCYEPPRDAPPISTPPAIKRGHATFGSFNNPAKIGLQVVEMWANILKRVPNSRLLLKYKGMQEPSICGGLKDEFASYGIDSSRIECLGWSPHAALLAEYNRIDLALDPFPYGGGLTTCEALWMGVPVITCPGETFASRHSLSHLSNIGLTNSVARSFDEYIELAVSWASNLPKLTEVRKSLRQQMAVSPLCDAKQFAANLTRILRGAWHEWCNQK